MAFYSFALLASLLHCFLVLYLVIILQDPFLMAFFFVVTKEGHTLIFDLNNNLTMGKSDYEIGHKLLVKPGMKIKFVDGLNAGSLDYASSCLSRAKLLQLIATFLRQGDPYFRGFAATMA
ncbi:hypothetical protein BGX38DRAFT_75020 [Terfezia claveryi]|nr:hypothetical protein BGX38DRAFT_75020 [Terfezia claveryi]